MGCDVLKLPETSSLDVSNMIGVDANLPRDVSLVDFNNKTANPGLNPSMKNVSDLIQVKSTAVGPGALNISPTSLVEQTTSGIENIGTELSKTVEDCFKSATSLKDRLKELLSKDLQLDIPDLQALLQKELEQMLKNFPNSPEAIIDMIRKSVSLSIDIPGLNVLNGLQLCVDGYLNEAAGLLGDIRNLACGSVNKLTPKAKLDMIKSPAIAQKNLNTITQGVKDQVQISIPTGKDVSVEPPSMDLPGLSSTDVDTPPVDPKPAPAEKATKSAQDVTQSETLQTEKIVSTTCDDFLHAWNGAVNDHVSAVVGSLFDLYWPDVFIKRGIFDKKASEAYNLLCNIGDEYVEKLVAKWFFTTYWDSSTCGTKSNGIKIDTIIEGSGDTLFQLPDRTFREIVSIWKWSSFSDTETLGVYTPSAGTLKLPTSRWGWVVEELFTADKWPSIEIRKLSTSTDTKVWTAPVFSQYSLVDQSDLQTSMEKFHDAVEEPLVRRMIKNRKMDELKKFQSAGLEQLIMSIEPLVDDDSKIVGKYSNFSMTGKSIPGDTIYYVSTFDWNAKQITDVSLLSGSPGDYLNW